MRRLAALLITAAADDCCWFARSPKGTTFEKPRQAIAACDTKHLCFVACSAARRRVAQTYYKERIAPKACTCDPNQIAREANFSSLARTPVSQSLRAVYAGAFLAPYKVAARVDWMSPRLRERASLLRDERATSVAVAVSVTLLPARLSR